MTAGALPFVGKSIVAGATTVGVGAFAVGTALGTSVAAAGLAVYDQVVNPNGVIYGTNGEILDYTKSAKAGIWLQNTGNSIKTFATGIVNGVTDRFEMAQNQQPVQGTGTNSSTNSTQGTGGNNGKPCGSKTGALLGTGTGAGIAGSNFLGEEQGLKKSVVQGASVFAGIAGGACDPIFTAGGTAVAGAGVGLYVKLDSQDKTIKKLQDQIEKTNQQQTTEQTPTSNPEVTPEQSPTPEQTPAPEPSPTSQPQEVQPEPATPPILNN